MSTVAPTIRYREENYNSPYDVDKLVVLCSSKRYDIFSLCKNGLTPYR